MRPKEVFVATELYIFEIREDETPTELWGYNSHPWEEEELIFIFELEHVASMTAPSPSPTPQIIRLGDSIIGFHPEKPDLSLTLLEWKESPITVDGPYVDGYYTFTAQPRMKFIILIYEFRNNGIRSETTPYLNSGEIETNKGYFYPVWSPKLGAHTEEYEPRQATNDEVKTLIGDSGGYEELLPEESTMGCVVFEIPEDQVPMKATIVGIPYPIMLADEQEPSE